MAGSGTHNTIMANSGLLEALMALGPALLRYLSLQGATADEAEDILQDVRLKVSTEKVAPVSQPRAYLYRMTHNHFLLHRRAAIRRERREQDWSDINGGDPPEIDEEPSVEARLVAREQLAILQGVLDRLPERTRLIFRRFRIEGMPQRQIAAELGISVSAVEKHLAHAYEAVAAMKTRFDEGSGTARSLKGERDRHGV